MKKILITGLTSNYGGIETTIINMYKLLDKNEYKIDFVNSRTKKLAYNDYLIKNGSTIYNITSYYKDKKKYYNELTKVLKNNRYDYVYCNYSSSRFILDSVCVKKNSDAKIIIHVHNSSSNKNILIKIKSFINKLKLRRIGDYYLSPSYEASKYFYNKKIINSKKHIYIDNFIDEENYKYDKEKKEIARQNLGIKKELLISNIGKYCSNKNQDFLIKIVDYLNNKGIKTRLLLIGNMYDNKFNDNVICTGVVNNVYDYLCASDVFVFPSKSEGYGISLIEAQLMKIPSLASTNVPRNTKISNAVKYINLDLGIEYWSNEIVKMSKMKIKDIKVKKNINKDINKIKNILK